MRRLTLSFDNGPAAGGTERILDILRDRGLRASFFVVGEELRKPGHRALAERAAAEGHWIGNHTMTHRVPLGEDPDPAHPEREIGATQELLGHLARPEKLFRPHGKGRLGPHLLSEAACDYLLQHAYTVVTWNNVPGDWKPPHRDWLPRALDTLERQDWSLLVLHDRWLRDMMDTLETFLDAVERSGVEIVQAFPASCLPVVRGKAGPGLDGLATGGGGQAST